MAVVKESPKLESGVGTASTVTVAGLLTGAAVARGVDPAIAAASVGFLGLLLGVVAQHARDERAVETETLAKPSLLWRILSIFG